MKKIIFNFFILSLGSGIDNKLVSERLYKTEISEVVSRSRLFLHFSTPSL